MIEQKLGQRLPPLACRYHILELIVEKAFESLMERTSMDDEIVQSVFADDYEAIVKFIRDQLHEQQVRDDYKNC